MLNQHTNANCSCRENSDSYTWHFKTLRVYRIKTSFLTVYRRGLTSAVSCEVLQAGQVKPSRVCQPPVCDWTHALHFVQLWIRVTCLANTSLTITTVMVTLKKNLHTHSFFKNLLEERKHSIPCLIIQRWIQKSEKHSSEEISLGS